MGVNQFPSYFMPSDEILVYFLYYLGLLLVPFCAIRYFHWVVMKVFFFNKICLGFSIKMNRRRTESACDYRTQRAP